MVAEAVRSVDTQAETTVLNFDWKEEIPESKLQPALRLVLFFDIYIQGSKYNFKS